MGLRFLEVEKIPGETICKFRDAESLEDEMQAFHVKKGPSENVPLALIKQEKKKFVFRMAGNCPAFRFLKSIFYKGV